MFFNELIRIFTERTERPSQVFPVTSTRSQLDRNAGGAWVDIPGHTIETDNKPIKLK